jgi:hypothetical protein
MMEVLEGIGQGGCLVPFGRAVAGHLTTPPAVLGPVDEVLAQVVNILLLAADPGEDLPVDQLMESPELLASFFQNADLLDRKSVEAGRVARLVTEALERAWEGAR